MGLAAAIPHVTEQEYLVQERVALEKHEYFQGEVFAMAGNTTAHVLVATNVLGELRARLKGKPCRAYESNLRLKMPSGLYTYADASVVCGKLDYAAADDKLETVTNPSVIFEILSESTESYDRGKKFENYRRIPSLNDYVLISQWEPLVEHFSRQGDGRWLLTTFSGMNARLALPSLQIDIPLAEIFDGVEFKPRPAC